MYVLRTVLPCCCSAAPPLAAGCGSGGGPGPLALPGRLLAAGCFSFFDSVLIKEYWTNNSTTLPGKPLLSFIADAPSRTQNFFYTPLEQCTHNLDDPEHRRGGIQLNKVMKYRTSTKFKSTMYFIHLELDSILGIPSFQTHETLVHCRENLCLC
jgi:hypothetical protein